LDEDIKALEELEHWHEILLRVRNMPDEAEAREGPIRALLERGVQEAPAMLAVDRAASPAVTPAPVPPEEPLDIEPPAVNFGLLRPGESANQTLTVTGRLRDVKPRSNRLSVALHREGPRRTLVKIMLTPGKPGESLSDELVLHGEGVEKKVPVTARWDVRREPAVPKDPQNPQPLRVCPTCKDVGLHGEGSLFWNWRGKKWGCLNRKCPDFYGNDRDRR